MGKAHSHDNQKRGQAGYESPDSARHDPNSEQLPLHEILYNFSDAFYAVDSAWRLSYLNKKAKEWLPELDEDILGNVLWDAFPKAQETISWTMHHKAMTERLPVQWEVYSGSVKAWLEVNAFPISNGGVAVFFRDITERKQAETALIEREKTYRTIIDTAGEGIVFAEPAGPYFFVNQRMADMLGYPIEEILGKSSTDFSWPDWHPDVHNARVDLEKGGSISGEFKFRRKDGTVLWTSYNATPMYDENGRHVTNFAMHTDITERKHTEQALRENQQKALALITELELADKNKNDFISILSHELRNPMAVIVTGLSLLEMSDNQAQISKTRDILKRQVRQLTKLVDDLLDLTRINQNKIKLKKEMVDLVSLLQNAVLDIQPKYSQKNIKLQTTLPQEPIYIEADPVRITQCASNLLENALKFTPDGGAISLLLLLENNEAVIRVEDNGVGISSDLLAHIFEPFTQADTTLDRGCDGGLGLGLSIVDGIIRLHGGHVAASSEGAGKGAQFTIRLPATSFSDGAAADTGAKKTGRARNILLIEDNKSLADFLCALLRLMGHHVHAAYTGPDGITEAEKTCPDVIFCDIGLPGLSGYEVAKALKADDRLSNAYLIALTGYASETDIDRVRQAGFSRHLAKPVDKAALEQLLEEIS